MTDPIVAPTAKQVKESEIATLKRIASGLREMLAARAVYCGTLSNGEILRFCAAAPAGTRMPTPLRLEDYQDLQKALRTGTACCVSGLGEPFEEQGESLVLPLASRGITFGLAIAATVPTTCILAESSLSLVGTKAGSTISAIRNAEDHAHSDIGVQEEPDTLGHLIDAVSDAVMVIDLDGRIVRWNSAAKVLYGWNASEVLGKKMPYLPKDARLGAIQEIRLIAASGQIVTRQASVLHSSGMRFAVDTRMIPVRDRNGNPCAVISVARRATVEEHTHCCSDGFVQAVSREINMPLTAIVGYAQLLTRPEILSDSSRRARATKALEGHALTLADLLTEAATLSRLAEGVAAPDREPVDIARLLADVVARFDGSRRTHRIVADIDFGSETVHVDRKLIERAIKAMLLFASSGDERTEQVAVSLTCKNTSVVIRVEARNTAGSSADTRGPMSTTRHPAGLGLYLAGLVAKAHGGSLETGEHAARRIRWCCLRVPTSGAFAKEV